MTLLSIIKRAQFLARTNFGRQSGWIVELDGCPIGQLTDCVKTDMFWDSYAIAPIHAADTSNLYNDELWNSAKFCFRNRESGEYANDAFCGGAPPFVKSGRILMRRLYLSPQHRSELLLVGMLSKLMRSCHRRGSSETARVNTASESTGSSAFASAGRAKGQPASR